MLKLGYECAKVKLPKNNYWKRENRIYSTHVRAKSCSVVPNCLQKFHNLLFDTPTRKTVSSAFNIHHKSLIFNHINSVLLHHNIKYPPPTYPTRHSYESPHYQISKKKIFLLFIFISILNLKNKALRKPLHLYPCWQ